MKVLLISVSYPRPGNDNMYADLMKEFCVNGHKTYVACACQKREHQPTSLQDEEGTKVLRLCTGNITGNVGLIEKGISTMVMDFQFIRAIRKAFRGIAFDLVLYSTPPIAFTGTLRWIHQHYNVQVCHLLKDIFPQSAVDLGMLGKSSLVCRYFRRCERKLYAQANMIGCTSQRNIDYILAHHAQIDEKRLFITRNAKKSIYQPIPDTYYREQLQLTKEDTLFLFGGNLGKPQATDSFLKYCDALLQYPHCYVAVAGTGTESTRIKEYEASAQRGRFFYLGFLDTTQYNRLLRAADIGLIFLDFRYTVPNNPMRYTEYLQAGLPMVAATDIVSDLSCWLDEYQLGIWSESRIECMDDLAERSYELTNNKQRLREYSKNARRLFDAEYTTELEYVAILNQYTNHMTVNDPSVGGSNPLQNT